MKIWLPTVPSFLQTRLKTSRHVLLGQKVTVVISKPTSRQAKQVNFGWLGLIILVSISALIWFMPGWKVAASQIWPTATTQKAHTWVSQSFDQLAGLVRLPTSTPTPEPKDSNADLGATPVAGQSGQNELVGNFNEPPVVQADQPADVNNRYLPPVNLDLPTGDWFIIPKIGVRSQYQATANYETALETGLWRAPDFGKPGSLEMPMIIAGHRYGWKWWWKDDYWKYNSFYLLPQVEVGDRVEVISEQRKWIYEIYAGNEGTEITDYDADLIIYTCKYLQSPLRFFRYARLVRE